MRPIVIFCHFLRPLGKQKIPIPFGNQDFTVFCFSSKWCHQQENFYLLSIEYHRFIVSSIWKST